jgi:hypothetical protein|tara:strand:+ start:244 stop:435 length:192 start_codon:yes stop_codon:yes gene_type:complete
MAIDKREANALVESMTSLLDSLDQNFDSLPSGLDTVVKEAKLTLLNVDTKDDRQRKIYRIFRQ